MFGGNSNWRGPVWFPMNLVILRALLQLHRYYGDGSRSSARPGSGSEMNLLRGRARRSADRLPRRSPRTSDGRRPVFGGIEKFQTDPHWHDLLLFHEYFHGDNGAGLGASHQTGWTGTVALLLLLGGAVPAEPGDRRRSERLSRAPAAAARPIYEINTAVWLERLGRERGAARARRGARRRVGRARRAAASTPSG